MTTTALDTPVQQQNILTNSVCLMLSCGYLGTTRTLDVKSLDIKKGEDTLQNEKRIIHASKRLIESEPLRPCRQTILAARAMLRSLAISGHRVFGPGTYLLPDGHLVEATQKLDAYITDLEVHKTALAKKWDSVVAEALATNGKIVDAKEFPTSADVLSDIYLHYRFVSFSSPERLSDVDPAIARASQQKWNAQLADAHNEYVLGLREAAHLALAELAAKLAPNKNGQPKALHPEALRDINDLLTRLPVLNIGGDDLLSESLARVGALCDGVTVDILRKVPVMRTMLIDAATEAASTVEALVKDAKVIRAIRL